MATMRAMSAVPLKQLDATWTPLQQAMEPVPSSPLAPAGAAPPPDMVAVPRNSSWRFSAANVAAMRGMFEDGITTFSFSSLWSSPSYESGRYRMR